jgi:hypothetical protein
LPTSRLPGFPRSISGELGPLEEISEAAPVIVFGDWGPTRAHAVITIADKCIKVAVEQHGEGHPAHRSGGAAPSEALSSMDVVIRGRS